MAHFAHYVKRVVAEPNYSSPDDPYYAEAQPDDQGLSAPSYHAAPGNSGVAGKVKPGDTIWLFSQLSSRWGTLPPSLDGLVAVAGVSQSRRNGVLRYRFSASPKSRWMPLFDATNLLRRLQAMTEAGSITPLLTEKNRAAGQALRYMRRIHDAAPILRHVGKIDTLRHDFISYRLIDGTQAAFDLAARLMREGRSVVWDRWSLPRRLAERREFLKDGALQRFIDRQIRASRVVHGVDTALYGERGSYSYRERKLAERLGILRMHTPTPVVTSSRSPPSPARVGRSGY